jgi:uncharacterized protein YgbK (DUF1537 family)
MPDLLLSYYGDDLTGSTDVMEALSSRGVPTVLFMREPTPEELARLDGVRAIGLAGTSRSESPAWMDEHLTPAFAWLKAQGALFCHYKVCSTFDSSPTVGSIGRAIDIGARVFGQDCVPLVVGAPALKRWTAFGQLFAGFRGEVYRIDRHPVMSVHPVTPMDEADLRIHLSRQTGRTIGLVDLPSLGGRDPDGTVDEALAARPGVLMLDVADLASQRQAGLQLWRTRRPGGTFVAGSSGVEYALLDAWAEEGIATGRAEFAAPGPVDRIAVVSGSCSPTTERQIRHASRNGFDAVALDPRLLAAGGPDGEEARRGIATGLAALSAGRSVVLYTALGPSTDMGAEIDRDPGARHGIGRALGRIQRRLVEEQGLRRAVIAGGDTSSHALRQLDVFALTTLLPLPDTPGSPLCRCSSSTPAFHGLEIALKGGQVGGDDYFSRIRAGRG